MYESIESEYLSKRFVIRWNQEFTPKIRTILKSIKIDEREKRFVEMTQNLITSRATDISALYSTCKMNNLVKDFEEFMDILLKLYQESIGYTP